MSESTAWQPPAGEPVPQQAPGPFAPPVASPSMPGSFPPPGSAPAAAQAPPGWTPPPKPGLIPLRPLTLGTLLGASFQVLRRNPRPTFGFSLLVTGTTTLLAVIVVGLVTFYAFARTATATGADADALAAGAIAMVLLSSLLPVGFGIVAAAILQGIVSLEVARGTLGEKHRLRGLWRAARGRLGALIGWALLVAAAILVGIGVISALIALIVVAGGAAGVAVAVLLGIIAALGAVVLYFWLSTRLCLVPSALMLERLPLRAAVARSWSLTQGYFWRTLGIQLLVAVILQTVTGIISLPLQMVLGLAGFLMNPNGQSDTLVVVVAVTYLLTLLVTVVFGAISAVVQSATSALIYIDLRMRKEGLDLELARFVEARQAGDASVPDPYLSATERARAA